MLPFISTKVIAAQSASFTIPYALSGQAQLANLFVVFDLAYTGDVAMALVRQGLTIPLNTLTLAAPNLAAVFLFHERIPILDKDQIIVTNSAAGDGTAMLVISQD